MAVHGDEEGSTPDDFGAFLRLLPASHEGVRLRHAIHVRHESFAVPEFVAMVRAANATLVYADSADYPGIADLGGDLVYARLEQADEQFPAGYAHDALDRWADVARTWQAGGQPEGLPYAAPRRGGTPYTAGDVRVLHQRRQGSRAAWRDGADRASGELTPVLG